MIPFAIPFGMSFGQSSFIRLTAFAGVAVVLAGLPAPARSQSQPLPNDATVRLAGANTVGVGMIPPWATAWSRKIGLPAIRTEPGQDNEEFTMLAEGAEGARKLRIEVKFHGTPTGTEPLIRGQADMWMTVRPARESDLEAVRRRNVPNVPSLSQFQAPGVENVVALDAVAVIVHPAHPVRKLSMAQMRDIFLGRVTNWSAVGGPNLPIAVYAPDPSFGTFEALCTGVLNIPNSQQCLAQLKLAAPPFKSVDDLSDTVSGAPGAIGWVGIVAKRNARAVQIETDCGSIHDADAFGVKAEEYPLARRYYIYVSPTRPPTLATAEFLKYMLSTEGQTVLRESGGVDLLPGVSSDDYAPGRLDVAGNALDGGHTRIRATDVQAFEDAIQDANRLSVTFRFREGMDALDARAEADLGRLAALMQAPAYAKSQLMLIGFSAARGDYNANRTLSRDRAAAVRERLVAMGVKNVASTGVGPASPVACNGEGGTATLNQRVEAWVRKIPGG